MIRKQRTERQKPHIIYAICPRWAKPNNNNFTFARELWKLRYTLRWPTTRRDAFVDFVRCQQVGKLSRDKSMCRNNSCERVEADTDKTAPPAQPTECIVLWVCDKLYV